VPFNPKSDDSAIQVFLSYRESFEDLRSWTEKKTTLVHYHLERDEASPSTALESEDEDRQVIRYLMGRLGLSALNGLASRWGLRMIFWSEGMVMSSVSKSFYYSLKTPPRVVPSIENFVIDAPESEGVYRSIAPNGYLKLDWGG
jgi:hypothetical protein